MSGLTNAGFSQRCAYIAAHTSSWAGDCLTLPEKYDQPVSAETVARFTDHIRGMLDRLDEQAGRSALECEP